MAELKFTVQTDSPTEETLDSAVISATWTDSLATGGHTVGFQIRTCFVGNGAPVKVEGKLSDGRKLGTVKTKVHANQATGEFDVPADVEFGDMATFKFKLSKHGLEGESDEIEAIPPLEITNMKWSADEARRGDTLTMSADVKGIRDNTEVRLVIYEYDENSANDRIAEIPARVKDKKVEAKWEYEYHEDTDGIPTQDELDQYGGNYNPPEYFFVIKYGGVEYGENQESGLLLFKDTIEFGLRDRDGKPLKGADWVVKMADGSEKKGKLDGSGKAVIEDVPPGPYRVSFPSCDGASGVDEEELLQG
jgi:hypothetical protein